MAATSFQQSILDSELPQSLTSFIDLQQHFGAEFEGLNTVEVGDRFASFVQKLIPQTDVGSDFDTPVINTKRSNDGGVDLTAQGKDGRSVLYIQAKFSVDRADTIDNVISKFQSYYTTAHSTPTNVKQGVLELDTRVVHFLLVTLSPIDKIIENYKNKNFASKAFFDKCDAEDRVKFLHGFQILSTLQAAYRKMHEIPANLTLNLEREPVCVNSVYLGVVSAKELQRLYTEFGDALFFENIRDFLGVQKERPGRSTPNEDITKTIKNEPEKMLARNNGIDHRTHLV